MRILWDFRLYSYGYAKRGIGIFTYHLAKAILEENKTDTIYIWGQKESLPDEIASWPVKWIPYTAGSWKSDLYTIPLHILRYNIDIFHYWVCLGPLHTIGMGIAHPCRVITTIYDLAVELWHDVPFASSKKRTWYWRTQKRLINQCTTAICISESTRKDLYRVVPKPHFNTEVVYFPISDALQTSSEKRKPYFITLGGSVHKNLKRTIEAFSIVRENNSSFELLVLGDLDRKAELPGMIPDYIRFEDMTTYAYHRQHAAGLIFCSLHEGLGLPVIEAMAYNCPLLCATIPSLKEICDNYACFVDPRDTSDIARGIENLITNQAYWVDRSREGKENYRTLCENSGRKIRTIYRK